MVDKWHKRQSAASRNPIEAMDQTLTATKRHFAKEILGNRVQVAGKYVNFENVGSNRGVIALDPAVQADAEIIAGLDKIAAAGVGGVIAISEAQYAEKKSQAASRPLGRPKEMLALRSRPKGNPVRRVPPPPEVTRHATAPAADPAPAAPAAAAPQPAPEPTTFRPPTRRISRKGKAAVPA
jgi:hypothetical protein